MSCLKKNQCRLCDSSNLDSIINLGKSPIGEDFHTKENMHIGNELFPLNLVRCVTCGNIQLGYVVSKESIYVENYLYNTARSIGLSAHFAQYAKCLTTLEGVKKGDFVVDIGSNEGIFLAEIQRLGFTICGVEPSKLSVKRAEQANIATVCDFFTKKVACDLQSKYGNAKVITTNNCFANIDNLSEVMNGVDALLADDGWFIIETGYGLDLIQNFVIDNIYHEHISYFLVKPLRSFFMQHDFDIAHVERVATKGGSIRVYARRASKVKKLESSVEMLMTLETELGFFTDSPYNRFASHAQTMKDTIVSAISSFTNGKPCAAFGSAVGCTTLMYWLEVGDYFTCMVDDNTVSHGLFSPGCNLQVHAFEYLNEKAIKKAVIFPWRYIESIKKNHQKFLDAGGEFLNILPSVQVHKK